MTDVRYYVLKALENKICFHFDDKALKKHIDWINEHVNVIDGEAEKQAYEIVLNNKYEEYLTSKYKGHKVIYISQECLEIDGRKIKVVEDTDGYTYRVQKTRVKAKNGAIGLMVACFGREFDWNLWGRELCNMINKKTKEIKC